MRFPCILCAPFLLLACSTKPPPTSESCAAQSGLSRMAPMTVEAWEFEVGPGGQPSLQGLPIVGMDAAPFRFGGVEYPGQWAFVAAGRRCGTPSPPAAVMRQVEREMRAFRAAPGAEAFVAEGFAVVVPVWFHIITCGGQGDVSAAVIQEQVRVLNAAFGDTGVSFSLAGVNRRENGSWYGMGYGSREEREAKAALGKDPRRNLNVYIANPPGNLLGWATFPWNLSADPARDGVVLLNSALPGGSAPYNLGATGVHEVGHWLGLYHTFEGGCSEPNDEVEDTPPEAGPRHGCPGQTDSCPLPGEDNNENYMSYVNDACMNLFTPGQVVRLRRMITLFRTDLGAANRFGASRAGLPVVR
ncbi:MAG: zinc metalloprotease [Phycisphaerae bacterium]|nr:zinc metalloprotease [Phycisphaerae bacterium]